MKQINFGKHSRSISSLFVVTLATLAASTAHADVDPMQNMNVRQVQPIAMTSQNNPQAPMPQQQGYYAPAGYQVIQQAPVIIQGNAPQGSAPQYQPQQPQQAPQYQPQTSAPTPATVPSMAAEPVVEGFADQVPLTVALQQILPQGYGYTLGDGVNPGQLVSWRGGRPWNQVLGDALGGSGLNYNVNNRLVMVGSNMAAPTVIAGNQQAPQAAMQPMPQQLPPPPAPAYQAPQAMPQPIVPQPQPMVEQYAPPPAPMADVPQAATTDQGLPIPQPLQIENPAIFTPQVWEARPGQTLRQILQDWCGRVGVELNWAAEYDYPVMATASVTGTFEEAVRTLLSGFDAAQPTPRARLHYNPAAGQSILIVEASGNHYGD